MLPLQGNQKNAPNSDSRVPLLREREELLAKPKAEVGFDTFLFHLALYFPPDSTPRPRQGSDEFVCYCKMHLRGLKD